MATKAQVNAFIAKIAPIAILQAAKHGNKIFPSVCIAQACCESAYGTSPKMIAANAVFGIKVGKSKYHFGTAWKDKAYSTKTKECYDGKTYTEITDMFRAYDTIEDATEDYFDLLCTAKRYQYALNQPTPLACITGIQKAPYATAPDYINTIMKIINNNGLTVYDTPAEDDEDDFASLIAPIPQNQPYKILEDYKLQADMYVRISPGGAHKRFSDLTKDGQKHGHSDSKGAILDKGTIVTVKEIRSLDGAIWLRIPSGWVCGIGKSGKVYIA